MLHQHHQRIRDRRNGLVLLETLIAAGVTLVMLSVAVPMVIRSARIWKQTRHQQVAADELSGQMDRLIAMPAESRRQAMEQLTVSPAIAEVLHDATIEGTLINDDDGNRIKLSIHWTRAGDPLPVTLVAWIDPLPTTPPESPSPGDAEPGDAEPGDAEPGDAEPGDAEPGDAEPGDAEPGDAEPGDAEPGDAEPGENDQEADQ